MKCRNNNKVLIFLGLFVAAQCALLFFSTHHLFKNQSANCELCATVENFSNGLKNSMVVLERGPEWISTTVRLVVTHVARQNGYLSRAPPKS